MTDLIIIGVLTLACVVVVVLIAAIYHKVSHMADDIAYIAYIIESVREVEGDNG